MSIIMARGLHEQDYPEMAIGDGILGPGEWSQKMSKIRSGSRVAGINNVPDTFSAFKESSFAAVKHSSMS
jgi:hypothetical protein